MAKSTLKPIMVLSDAHGFYHSLSAVLIHAGLIDPDLNWTGKNTILVQMGDIIDRGHDYKAIDILLNYLQIQSKKEKGQVVRLLGNHELEILKKNYFVTTMPYWEIEPFRAKLIKDILEGKIQAAWAGRGFLFTHSGCTDALFNLLKKELPAKPTPQNLAKLLNKILVDCVKREDFSHPIFYVSRSRGGIDPFAGIFWADLNELLLSHKTCPFKQIVGHTMVQGIVSSTDGKVICVDVGMPRVFEGTFEYLKFKNNKYQVIKIEE
ncbi:MAG: metallophosphoesterase [Elusimicrobiaceae bacterium]|nr:metallophosphoesterase [Elusimicrobiaceae bacterium]